MLENVFCQKMSSSFRTRPPNLPHPSHCNYNGEIGRKWDLVITFDKEVLLTEGQRVWTARSFLRDIPLDRIWHDQICAPKFCIWPYSGAYLCSPYIIKWGIPETILQNAVQTRWPCVSRSLPVKSYDKHYSKSGLILSFCFTKYCYL